jgi:hypothetical protein
MPRLQPARFRAKVFAYRVFAGWNWAYEVTVDAPWATKVVAAGARFGSQPEALAGALAALRNLGPKHQDDDSGCASMTPGEFEAFTARHGVRWEAT